MAMNKSIKTVDDYLEKLSDDYRDALQNLRATIRSAAPDAEETISYGMPAYKYHGPLVYMAAFNEHCSFFPGSSQIIKQFDELKAYRTSKGTIQFTVDKPLPKSLVKKIVKARMKENITREEARQLAKSAKRKSVKKKH